jgi:hypothetical protein
LARRIGLLVALAALAVVPLARADGDPASDYLLVQQTFVPPDDGIPAAYAAQLVATVREAKARGYTVRVALIGSRYDMGSVTVLYGKPRQYARFLGEELSLVYKQRLLVVMRNGLAVSRRGKLLPAEQKVVDRLPAPRLGGAALASTASTAVMQLAAANGVVFPKPPLVASGPSGGNSTTRDRITIVAAAAVLAALAALVVLARRRFRR